MWRHQASYPDSQWQAIELHASQSITSLISPPTKEDARKRSVILDRQVSAHSGMGGRNGRKKRPELAAQLHSEAWHCTRAPHLSMERDTDGSLGSRGVGASIRARPGHEHAPTPTRRSIAVFGTKEGARHHPGPLRTHPSANFLHIYYYIQ